MRLRPLKLANGLGIALISLALGTGAAGCGNPAP
jgi:hypothetical protein